MKAPPPLCRHVDIGASMGKDEPTLDPYSLRVDCSDCQAVGGWLVSAHKEALAAFQGKAPPLPQWCKIGATCRRNPNGRSCTIKNIDGAKQRVLVYDNGHAFWATYLTIITEWRA
jgi:hypothetical protein